MSVCGNAILGVRLPGGIRQTIVFPIGETIVLIHDRCQGKKPAEQNLGWLLAPVVVEVCGIVRFLWLHRCETIRSSGHHSTCRVGLRPHHSMSRLLRSQIRMSSQCAKHASDFLHRLRAAAHCSPTPVLEKACTQPRSCRSKSGGRYLPLQSPNLPATGANLDCPLNNQIVCCLPTVDNSLSVARRCCIQYRSPWATRMGHIFRGRNSIPGFTGQTGIEPHRPLRDATRYFSRNKRESF